MPRYFLKEISIEGFRGINNQGDPLRLKFDTGKVNSLFGANALGKSSTFEALSFAIRGVVPKLAKLPASDEPATYYANRFHSGGDSTVTLALEADDCSGIVTIEVKRSTSGIRTVSSPSGCPDDPETFLKSLDSELALLDYETFLEFVSDTPLKRGRTFSGLLGLSRLSECRQALEVLANQRNLNTDFNLETQQHLKVREEQAVKESEKRLRAAYRMFLSAEADPILDPDAASSAALRALKELPTVGDLVTETSLAEIDFNKLRAAIRAAEGSLDRERLSKVLQDIGKLRSLSQPDEEADELFTLTQTLKQRDAALSETRGTFFHKLYEAVDQLYMTGEWSKHDDCPACESNLDFHLDERIRQKLSQYEAVVAANQNLAQSWTTSNWPKRLKTLEEADTLGIADTKRQYTLLSTQFTTANISVDHLAAVKAQLEWLDSISSARLQELEAEKQTLETTLPPSLVALTEQVEHAASLQQAIQEVKSSTAKIAAIQLRLDLHQSWVVFIQDIAKEFARAEVKLSTVQTTNLETEYRAMYEQVTSNPEIVPMLKKADSSEELHLKLAQFYGLQNLSATTLLPESYRNALAICIYLSTALRSTSKARFIILDDVTSSFDAGHQWNLMEVIRTRIAYPENPNGPQLIILSHDGLLEKYFDTMATESRWHHQRLQGMPPKGVVYPHTQDVNRIGQAARTHLSAGQTQVAMPLIRQYLEQKLLQIIRKLEIPVPLDFSIRDDRKMVKNCLDAIGEAISLHQGAGSLILTLQQVNDLTGVYVPSIVGNWVSHYSTSSAASVTPYVLLGVLDAIDKLADCFRYPCACGGGTQQRFYKSLSSKACACP